MSYAKPAELAPVLISPGMGWSRFTYARSDMELIGVVQSGMQIGALARLPSGDYVQVNGDFVEHLEADRLAKALRRAGISEPGARIEREAAPATTPAVTVTIKKRRRIASDTTA